MGDLPARYARRAELASNFKGGHVLTGMTCIAILWASIVTYRTIPGVFHSYLYDFETFRDCPTCPEMVVIPAGTFQMGSEEGSHTERPVRQVTIRYDFAVGIFEVTQGEWYAVMGTHPGKYRQDNLPVERVSWYNARDYVRALSEQTGETYRLLTEAEWEYMARGGTSSHWACGDDGDCIDLYGWHYGNSKTNNPVGQKRANGYGVYDVHGNVWEWVEDCYRFQYENAPSDGSVRPRDPSILCERAMRGGSTYTIPWKMRSSVRFRNLPEHKFLNLGFRVARDM